MGMYTELVLNVTLKDDVPPSVIELLGAMAAGKTIPPDAYPDHEFFSQGSRVWAIFNSASYYFIPKATTAFWKDDVSNQHFISTRFDLKNYKSEIELFVDWLTPYIDAFPGAFLGYKRYEEELLPTLLIHPNRWVETAFV